MQPGWFTLDTHVGYLTSEVCTNLNLMDKHYMSASLLQLYPEMNKIDSPTTHIKKEHPNSLCTLNLKTEYIFCLL